MGTFDWKVIVDNFPFLMRGLGMTFQLAIIATIGGLILGTLVGMARISSRAYIYYPATVFVNLLRSIPLILVIFWFYFLVPIIAGRPLGDFLSATIAFVIFEASYFAEIIRAGIQSIHRGQSEAGLSLGMTYLQVFRYVILMPTLRVVWPPLASQFIATMLGSSVVSQISAEELTYAGMLLESRTFRTFEIFFFIAIIYFVMAQAFSILFSLTGRRVFRRAWGQL